MSVSQAIEACGVTQISLFLDADTPVMHRRVFKKKTYN